MHTGPSFLVFLVRSSLLLSLFPSLQQQDYLNNQRLLQFSTRLSYQNIFYIFLVVSIESFYAKLKRRAKISALPVFRDRLFDPTSTF